VIAPDLFTGLTDHLPKSEWRPEPPPPLDNIHDIELDCETTGLRWWADDLPVGISIGLPDGRTQYLPWGHRAGGNLDEAQVKRWAFRELRGKRITNLNTRFDIHMLRKWGIDLDAQDNEVSDVSHYAALLDDHRYEFSLAALCKEFLGPTEQKVKIVDGHELDQNRMHEYHAGTVAVRAVADVRQVRLLKQVFWPMLDAQGLQRVRKLEDEVIFPVCEMEKNGTLLDVELLNRWIDESEALFHRLVRDIYLETGVPFTPSPTGWAALFKIRGAVTTEVTAKTKRDSYSDHAVKVIKDPIIQKARLATKIKSLREKYLLKDKASIGPDGILRYALHQLRSKKDDGADETATGTISGRFSSTEILKGEGQNIQQRMKVAKQRESFGYDENDASHDDEIFIIRKLHIPPPGWLFLSADAKQIEYRLFAHYANNPRVMQAYADDPDLKFHHFMQNEVLKPRKPDISYAQTKNLNFANIYGAGIIKKAVMLGFISESEAAEIRAAKRWNDPRLETTKEINQVYQHEMPEVPKLLARAGSLAEVRGYVKTLLGRRMRFPDKQRLHKALNGVIQGTAADINKQKLVDLHRARKYTGLVMCFTVHDEVDGYVPARENADRVAEVLDAQSIPLRVPILWDVGCGPNWAHCE